MDGLLAAAKRHGLDHICLHFDSEGPGAVFPKGELSLLTDFVAESGDKAVDALEPTEQVLTHAKVGQLEKPPAYCGTSSLPIFEGSMGLERLAWMLEATPVVSWTQCAIHVADLVGAAALQMKREPAMTTSRTTRSTQVAGRSWNERPRHCSDNPEMTSVRSPATKDT